MNISGGRGSGKTTRLIQMAHERNLYIICTNQQRVREIMVMAKAMQMSIPFPITVAELPLHGTYIKKVLVDNVEDVLEHWLDFQVEAFTSSRPLQRLHHNRKE